MRRRDDRPGDAGGFPDQGSFGAPVGAGAQGTAGTRGIGARNYYYDDDAGYTDTEATSVVKPASERSDDYYDDLGGYGKEFAWNVGTDLGLLIIRLVLGGILLTHGSQKLFGVLGGSGPGEFARTLQDMGFQQSATLSLVTGGTELGSGALLVLGLFTPLAAAGLIGLMVNVVALNATDPFFASQGGYEYEAVLLGMAVALLFTGPGRAAFDNGRAWFRRPVVSGVICLVIGAGAGAAVFLLLR